MLVPNDSSVRSIFYSNLGKGRDYVNDRGLLRTAIFKAVKASLERLQINYIDLLQIHRYTS